MSRYLVLLGALLLVACSSNSGGFYDLRVTDAVFLDSDTNKTVCLTVGDANPQCSTGVEVAADPVTFSVDLDDINRATVDQRVDNLVVNSLQLNDTETKPTTTSAGRTLTVEVTYEGE